MWMLKKLLVAIGLAACPGVVLAQDAPKNSVPDKPAAELRDGRGTPGAVGVILPARSPKNLDSKFAGKSIGEVLLHAMQTIRDLNGLPENEQGPAMMEAADAYEWVSGQAAKQSDEKAQEARQAREATAELRKDSGPVLEAQEELTKAGAQFEQQLEAARKRAETARATLAYNPDDPSAQAMARFEFAALKSAEQAATQARQIMTATTGPASLITQRLQMLELGIRCREADAAMLKMASNSWTANAKALRNLGKLTIKLGDFSKEPAVKVDWIDGMFGQGTQLSQNDEREFQTWLADENAQRN